MDRRQTFDAPVLSDDRGFDAARNILLALIATLPGGALHLLNVLTEACRNHRAQQVDKLLRRSNRPV